MQMTGQRVWHRYALQRCGCWSPDIALGCPASRDRRLLSPGALVCLLTRQAEQASNRCNTGRSAAKDKRKCK